MCILYRNLVKLRQAEKRGEGEAHVTGISDISQHTAERLRHHSSGDCVSQKSETREDPSISLLWRR